MHRILRCTHLERIAIVPRVRVPKRSKRMLTTCPRLSYANRPCASNRIYVNGRRAFGFFRSILSRIVQLFPSQCVRVKNSRTDEHR